MSRPEASPLARTFAGKPLRRICSLFAVETTRNVPPTPVEDALTASAARFVIQDAQIASLTKHWQLATTTLEVNNQRATYTHNGVVQCCSLAMRLGYDRVEAEEHRVATAREAQQKPLRLFQQMDEQRATSARLGQVYLFAS